MKKAIEIAKQLRIADCTHGQKCPGNRCVLCTATAISKQVKEALEEAERVIDDCTYECDCGKVYRDCDAKAHHVAAIRQARG